MRLEGARLLQDRTHSDDRYLCVLIARSSVGSWSMQELPYCRQACIPYSCQDQYTFCALCPEEIGQTIDLAWYMWREQRTQIRSSILMLSFASCLTTRLGLHRT
jgi:hypothetical protein